MSLLTWKAEFITDSGNLLQDGYNKWVGVRERHLDFHDCHLNPQFTTVIGEDDKFSLAQCGLCDLYLYPRDADCSGCPIEKSIGSCVDNDEHPYKIFDETGDPEPMIKALEKLATQPMILKSERLVMKTQKEWREFEDSLRLGVTYNQGELMALIEDHLSELLDHVDELQEEADFLERLRAVGVDNWEGYGDA